MPGPLPLLGLRAFVEVGQAGSMKRAAAQLGVTPGAVSQQVKSLEVRLGLTLFERLNREVRLTADGQRLLSDLSEAFALIESALVKLRPPTARGTSLVVSTTGAFAATWLVPRLGRFTRQHPRIDVRILTSSELVPLGGGADQADIAIRHGLGDWPGCDAERLLQPRLVPVGSPALLAAGAPITAAADCLHYPLLHDAEALDWPLWMRAIGGRHRDPRLAAGARFADSTLLARAAVAGQGLALLRDTYVADEIAAGRLRVAFDAPWPAAFAYYVVTRPGARRGNGPVAAFADWVLREAAAEQARPAAML